MNPPTLLGLCTIVIQAVAKPVHLPSAVPFPRRDVMRLGNIL